MRGEYECTRVNTVSHVLCSPLPPDIPIRLAWVQLSFLLAAPESIYCVKKCNADP